MSRVNVRWGAPAPPRPPGPAGKQAKEGFYFCTCDCYDFERRMGKMAGMSKDEFESRLGRTDQVFIAHRFHDGVMEWLEVEHGIRLSSDTHELDEHGFLVFNLRDDPWRMFVVTKTIKPYKDPERDPKVTYHLVTVTFEASDPTDWACKHTMVASCFLAEQKKKREKLAPVWLPGNESEPVVFINGIVGVDQSS